MGRPHSRPMAPETQKPRPSRFRPPALAAAAIVVAVALVAGGVFAVLESGGIRHLLPGRPEAKLQLVQRLPLRHRATAWQLSPLRRQVALTRPRWWRSLSTRDMLAQLLMVGVTGAADARTAVADQHVGGIFIGSFTDLSMFNRRDTDRHRLLRRAH